MLLNVHSFIWERYQFQVFFPMFRVFWGKTAYREGLRNLNDRKIYEVNPYCSYSNCFRIGDRHSFRCLLITFSPRFRKCSIYRVNVLFVFNTKTGLISTFNLYEMGGCSLAFVKAAMAIAFCSFVKTIAAIKQKEKLIAEERTQELSPLMLTCTWNTCLANASIGRQPSQLGTQYQTHLVIRGAPSHLTSESWMILCAKLCGLSP